MENNFKKRVVVIGGGGFIGGHLSKRLKTEGCFVRIIDIKPHNYFSEEEICHEFIIADLRNSSEAFKCIPDNVDEVYQLAADMGGAGYISTGANDANVMSNSVIINVNILNECVNKKVKKVFFASTACVYPEHNQLDPDNPNCEESSAYPANPDSEYGWEKLFSERLYSAYSRNYTLCVKIARFHNIFGPYGTWDGGREKAPAAIMRKVASAPEGSTIEIWGDGLQTRSFLYVEECIEAIIRLMKSSFNGPVNIGSEQLISVNNFTKLVIDISQKDIKVHNIKGEEFLAKYGFNCPIGVRGRNSNNKLYKEKIGWVVSSPLEEGIRKTYKWIAEQVNKKHSNGIPKA